MPATTTSFASILGQIRPLIGSGDRWAAHGAKVLDGYLGKEASDFDEGTRYYTLRHVAGFQDDIRDIFDQMDTSSDEGWANIATRLETMSQPLAGWKQTFSEGIARGQMVARRQAESVKEQFEHLAGPESKFLGLAESAAESGLAERVKAAADVARAAVADFVAYIETSYLPYAEEADGAGKARYISAADGFLGMAIDPAETYEWGWSEVHRLQDAMTAVAQEIDSNKSLGEVIEMLEGDPRYASPSQAAFVEFIQERQDQALHQLDGAHFTVPDQIKTVTVNLVPPGAALGAYYMQPSEDFTRPGGIWYSFGEREQIPLWGEVSTAYHEGFPGHHLQVGTAMAQAANLTRAHRLMVWYSGYGEGWALYTERLMDELGYFEKPEYLLGMYGAQQMRACRVVVDIGLHLGFDIPEHGLVNPGQAWSFDTAVQMMNQVAALPLDVATSEVIRYLGWPAQAPPTRWGSERFWRSGTKPGHAPTTTRRNFIAPSSKVVRCGSTISGRWCSEAQVGKGTAAKVWGLFGRTRGRDRSWRCERPSKSRRSTSLSRFRQSRPRGSGCRCRQR